jgi:hypothetical protein
MRVASVALCLGGILVSGSAYSLASSLGQPMDCSDWTFTAPGFSCSVYGTVGGLPSTSVFFQLASYAPGSDFIVEGGGHILAVRFNIDRPSGCSSCAVGRTEIVETDGQGEVVIGYVEDRGSPPSNYDYVDHLRSLSCGMPCTAGYGIVAHPVAFDPIGGRLLIPMQSFCTQTGSQDCPSYSTSTWIAAISGFPKLFDTLLTFLPGGQTLVAVTPVMPDGFRSADSLQVWTGNVRTMPDWSQAQPLACMAASNPTPGQVVSVPDTLPDPAVGDGRYYLVGSVSGADRRLGRQYVNGAFSARQPATLPACQ